MSTQNTDAGKDSKDPNTSWLDLRPNSVNEPPAASETPTKASTSWYDPNAGDEDPAQPQSTAADTRATETAATATQGDDRPVSMLSIVKRMQENLGEGDKYSRRVEIKAGDGSVKGSQENWKTEPGTGSKGDGW
jgi:hypothetical protein